ncbi:hypothetical protein F511_17532 [Dorcoceras hygrometricum]|uniref:Protein CHAPERONE-LIKE PROTEIN OF POR1, chloroplastic n=1 Tax=Dorcoceras hygrometricum TaxID=472368 RepID=A0A2Z7C4G3_9LAMI|nr:hypothetical protein F511_17532 [Dorcoceras hygrometricum]
MATALLVRPNHSLLGRGPAGSHRPRPPTPRRPPSCPTIKAVKPDRRGSWGTPFTRRMLALPIQAGSRADDSASFEMSVENALKLLGVPEEASFEDILRAKNSLIATCKDDQQAISQVEAAYDMLLMQSLSQRRAGKVVNSNIRYADVKPVNASKMDSMPKWLQSTVKNSPLSVEAPSTSELGVQAGVYGALMVLTYVNGVSASSTAPYAGADVPGLILATSFGASLYFLTKKNIKLVPFTETWGNYKPCIFSLGKATVITIGGLLAGAVVGSAVESWLQVDIVPFLGLHSPATVVSEFILFSQLLVSLYLR